MAARELDIVATQPFVPQVSVTPDQALKAYQALREITKKVLVEGTDYGVIPGTPKPSLFKPGAENLLRFYGLGHTVEKVGSLEDWENGTFYFEYKVTIHKSFADGTRHVLAECIGSCNSREPKYYKKKNGDLRDPYEQVNTFQKMAIKRALVGATLQATGASGLFTQDVEDYSESERPIGNERSSRNQQHHPNPHPKAQAIEIMKKLEFNWDNLAEVATDVLGRPIKKVVADIKTEDDWRKVADMLAEMLENKMNVPANEPPSEHPDLPTDEANLGF